MKFSAGDLLFDYGAFDYPEPDIEPAIHRGIIYEVSEEGVFIKWYYGGDYPKKLRKQTYEKICHPKALEAAIAFGVIKYSGAK